MDKTSTETRSKEIKLDADGFSNVHRESRDRLVRSINGFVRDHDKAQDIAATAFQIAWENRERFRGASSPDTWLQAIARNQARNSLRRESIARFDRIDAREIPAPGLLTDDLEKRDEHLGLQRALKQLHAKYRRVLVAHFIHGLSIRDTARRERVPSGTVLSRIFRGKQLLRQAWEEGVGAGAHNGTTASTKTEARENPQLPVPTPSRSSQGPEPTTWDR